MKRMMAKMSSSGNNSLDIHTTSYALYMQAEYRKIQQKSDGQTLLVTIPTAFAQAVPLKKSDTVMMKLDKNKRIVVQRATN